MLPTAEVTSSLHTIASVRGTELLPILILVTCKLPALKPLLDLVGRSPHNVWSVDVEADGEEVVITARRLPG